MEETEYRTVAGSGRAEFRIRGSRFIGHVDHVDVPANAQGMIDEVDEAHPDATHIIPVYRIRTDPFLEYQTDAGEPAGSAGPPILSVLRGQELENVIVIVVRYYGGTNLGIGGLVRAYGEAAKRAIEDAEVVEREPQQELHVETTYDDSGTVRSILESSGTEFEANYGEQVSFEVRVPITDANSLRDRLLSATSGRAIIRES